MTMIPNSSERSAIDDGTGRDGCDRPGRRLLFVPGLVSAGLESALLAQRLRRRGLDLEVFRHVARSESPRDIARRLAETIQGDPDLHLVGHSMGGLLALAALDNAADWTGRAVLLGSPVAGSAAAKHILKWPGGASILGKAREWLVMPPGVRADPRRIAVMAGTRDFGLGPLLGLRPGSSDVLVDVDETRLPGATSLHYPVSHLGLLFDPRVAEDIAEFIRTGAVVPTRVP